MKLREFAELVANLAGHPAYAECDVVILRSDPSVGPHACTDVKNIAAGFDWDNGKILIFPERLLYMHSDTETIRALRHQIDGLSWDLNQERNERRRMASKIHEMIPLLDQGKVDDELLKKLSE